MAIVVISPHTARPVKVREQDVGRAVRDGEGKIFYVLPKSDGSGYYGAPTRVGGPRDEQRALTLEAKLDTQQEYAREQVAQAHDATGRRRGKGGRLLLLLILLAVLAAAGWYAYNQGMLDRWLPGWIPAHQPPAAPAAPTPPPG